MAGRAARERRRTVWRATEGMLPSPLEMMHPLVLDHWFAPGMLPRPFASRDRGIASTPSAPPAPAPGEGFCRPAYQRIGRGLLAMARAAFFRRVRASTERVGAIFQEARLEYPIGKKKILLARLARAPERKNAELCSEGSARVTRPTDLLVKETRGCSRGRRMRSPRRGAKVSGPHDG